MVWFIEIIPLQFLSLWVKLLLAIENQPLSYKVEEKIPQPLPQLRRFRDRRRW